MSTIDFVSNTLTGLVKYTVDGNNNSFDIYVSNSKLIGEIKPTSTGGTTPDVETAIEIADGVTANINGSAYNPANGASVVSDPEAEEAAFAPPTASATPPVETEPEPEPEQEPDQEPEPEPEPDDGEGG